jgi:hypothetical protein
LITGEEQKKYIGELLPKEIADDIKILATWHKRYHIAKALKMSGDTYKRLEKGKFCFSFNKNEGVSEIWMN